MPNAPMGKSPLASRFRSLLCVAAGHRASFGIHRAIEIETGDECAAQLGSRLPRHGGGGRRLLFLARPADSTVRSFASRCRRFIRAADAYSGYPGCRADRSLRGARVLRLERTQAVA